MGNFLAGDTLTIFGHIAICEPQTVAKETQFVIMTINDFGALLFTASMYLKCRIAVLFHPILAKIRNINSNYNQQNEFQIRNHLSSYFFSLCHVNLSQKRK